MTQAWNAPTLSNPVHATITLPGSKSATNRALVLAATTEENQQSTVLNPLCARDTILMAEALRRFGVDVDTTPQHTWTVTSRPFATPPLIDCGLAGTLMRFLPPLATRAQGAITFDGDPHARKRPMAVMLEALRQLGADIDGHQLPFTLHATGTLPGGHVTLDASASSQFISGLLLAAPSFHKGVTVRHRGSRLPSTPHIAMTIQMLQQAGARVDTGDNEWTVHPGPLQARTWTIEPDLSNAAPFLGAALATDGEVTILQWPHHTTQAGDALRDLLAAMGASVTLTEQGLTVRGNGRINGIDVDLHDVGELTPVLAALCALADHPSRLRGIAHLRGHETNRLAALATELTRLGAHVQEHQDGLSIHPRPLHGGRFATYDDHRMAQAGTLLGLVIPGVVVENIATTAKTMPEFQNLWQQSFLEK